MVELDGFEIEIAKIVAAEKIKETRRAGGINTPFAQKQIVIDTDAYGAELAFCKLVNVYPDLTTHFRIKGYDAFLWEYRIDIKQTRYDNGKLIARATKKIEDADIYCQMVGRLPQYNFKGWVYASELIDEKNLEDLGSHGVPCYTLPQHKLRSPDLLIK